MNSRKTLKTKDQKLDLKLYQVVLKKYILRKTHKMIYFKQFTWILWPNQKDRAKNSDTITLKDYKTEQRKVILLLIQVLGKTYLKKRANLKFQHKKQLLWVNIQIQVANVTAWYYSQFLNKCSKTKVQNWVVKTLILQNHRFQAKIESNFLII